MILVTVASRLAPPEVGLTSVRDHGCLDLLSNRRGCRLPRFGSLWSGQVHVAEGSDLGLERLFERTRVLSGQGVLLWQDPVSPREQVST
jgi:hypothetical protein